MVRGPEDRRSEQELDEEIEAVIRENGRDALDEYLDLLDVLLEND